MKGPRSGVILALRYTLSWVVTTRDEKKAAASTPNMNKVAGEPLSMRFNFTSKRHCKNVGAAYGRTPEATARA
jgi:hypothetical protein